MAEYLEAVQGPSRTLPFLGDDDGGRLFHPYGRRDRFGRATLATASLLLGRDDFSYDPEDAWEQACWWLGTPALEPQRSSAAAPAVSRMFPQSGMCVLAEGDVHVLFDAGPFGVGNAGHSHSDTLSVVVRRGETEVLVDAGTYTYLADIAWRNRFRGTPAHNTVRIDGLDQAYAEGPFRWRDKPQVELRNWQAEPGRTMVDAECRYAGLRHRRRLLLTPQLLVIVDDLEGPDGEHQVEQFWHPGMAPERTGTHTFQIAGAALLSLPQALAAELAEGGEWGWRSLVMGHKDPAPVIRAGGRFRFPLTLIAVVDFSAGEGTLPVKDHVDGDKIRTE